MQTEAREPESTHMMQPVKPSGHAAAGSRSTTAGKPPVSVIERLLATLGNHGLQKTDALGSPDGSWVKDETILRVLQFLEGDAAQHLTYLAESYDVRACYLNTSSNQVMFPDDDTDGLPLSNMVLLMVHLADADEEAGTHFSVIIINKKLKLVHAFDTMSSWSGETSACRYGIVGVSPAAAAVPFAVGLRCPVQIL